MAEGKQRALLAARLEREERARASIRELQAQIEDADKAAEEAPKQSKPEEQEKQLSAKYGPMDIEERAFAILVDLGMVATSPDPDAANYDSSRDDEFVE